MPKTTSHTLTCHALEVPELVALICSFTEKPHLAKLMTVSRQLFYGAAPLVWKKVTGMTRILDLFPPLNADELKLVSLSI